MKALHPILFVLAISVLSSAQQAQPAADPALKAVIDKIKAIDNHAHPLKVVREGEPADNEYDALPLDVIEPSTSPMQIRPDNPEFIAAWKSLFHYQYSDMAAPHVQELLTTKQATMRQHGDGYSAWVLDQLCIEIMFANRVVMGRGLTAPTRFRWVSFVDALMIPLNNHASGATPDQKVLFKKETELRERYLAELNLKQIPATLDQYLSQVVTPTLEKQKNGGAVAVKFEAAYLRPLDFSQVSLETASAIYARYARGNAPPAGTDYKLLQDFLFSYISREAGRLGLVVHIHSCDGGGGSYQQSGSDPFLLESAFNDPTLRKTNFVIVHGGCQPYYRHTASLLSKPNVYADFSAMTFLMSARELSNALRLWLESYPEKVLFGTDAFAMSPEIGWEEVGWLSATTGRQALALALTGMMNDGEITRERAVELANMTLRGNASRLYRLKE